MKNEFLCWRVLWWLRVILISEFFISGTSSEPVFCTILSVRCCVCHDWNVAFSIFYFNFLLLYFYFTVICHCINNNFFLQCLLSFLIIIPNSSFRVLKPFVVQNILTYLFLGMLRSIRLEFRDFWEFWFIAEFLKPCVYSFLYFDN